MVSQVLLEEMFADLEDIALRMEQFAGRWGKYGEKLQDQLTPGQRARMEAVFGAVLARIGAMAGDD